MAATIWPVKNADISSAGSAWKSIVNTTIDTTTALDVQECSTKTKTMPYTKD